MSQRSWSNDEGILTELGARYNEQTPDFLDRKLEGIIPVFVYGTLRSGVSNHGLLEGMPCLGRASTSFEKFELREPHHGGFPVVFNTGTRTKKENSSSGRIAGEVYAVDPLTLLELDRLENNGTMYSRSLEWILLKDQDSKFKTGFKPVIHAWIYTGVPKFWRDRTTISCPSNIVSGVRHYDWGKTSMFTQKSNLLL